MAQQIINLGAAGSGAGGDDARTAFEKAIANFAELYQQFADKAPLASPALTGNPTAPTPPTTDNDTSISTTAFVRAAMALFGLGVSSTPVGLYVTDADALTVSGEYAVGATWVGSPYSGTNGANQGSLKHTVNFQTTAYAKQEWTSLTLTKPQKLMRVKINGAWQAWQEVWHTGNLVKQTGSTDATAGALMAVGAFGLGGANAPLSDVASLTKTTFFRYSSATVGAPVGGYGEGVYIHALDQDGGYGGAIFVDYVKDSISFKRKTAGVWAGAKELFYKGNILGTVSQSGGVPTGAIIERGSNANGHYTKLADGTLTCWIRAFTLSNTAGNETVATWNFPAQFIDYEYSLSLTVSAVDMSHGYYINKLVGNGRSIDYCEIRLVTNYTQKYNIGAFAIGRWY